MIRNALNVFPQETNPSNLFPVVAAVAAATLCVTHSFLLRIYKILYKSRLQNSCVYLVIVDFKDYNLEVEWIETQKRDPAKVGVGRSMGLKSRVFCSHDFL